MFRHQTVVFRESDKTNDWCVGLVFLCFSRLPEDGSLVPKHVGVDTCHVLYFEIGILLDFKDCISWLIHLTRLLYTFLKFYFRRGTGNHRFFLYRLFQTQASL
jgi:hypothetical protein